MLTTIKLINDVTLVKNFLKLFSLSVYHQKYYFSSFTVTLYERLAELEDKKRTIIDEINAEGTPDEQRERLLQTVIRTTDEINVIQKQSVTSIRTIHFIN